VTDPVTTLFRLTDEIQNLDKVQSWIDEARVAAKTNQRVQLELDRRQNDIDRKRFMIAAVMSDIRNRN
jgi:uncharacterized protein YciW